MSNYPGGWDTVKPANKYGAKRTAIDGIYFDSKAEAKRYTELRLMQAAGLITKLETHPCYEIEYHFKKICVVELDFKYFDHKRGEYVIEDVKGQDNPLSILKRKLVEAFHGIKVEVIKKAGAA